MITEAKERIKIQDLAIPEPQEEQTLFDPHRFLHEDNLDMMVENIFNQGGFAAQFIILGDLRIISPEKAAGVELPDSVFENMKRVLKKAKKDKTWRNILHTTSAIARALPEKREEFPVSNKIWKMAEEALRGYAERKQWIDFLKVGSDMKLIRPDYEHGINLLEEDFKDMKEVAYSRSGSETFPLSNFVRLRMLFPTRADLYTMDKSFWRSVNEGFDRKNTSGIFTSHDFADAIVLTADTVRITTERGMEVINNPRFYLGQMPIPRIPQRRRF